MKSIFSSPIASLAADFRFGKRGNQLHVRCAPSRREWETIMAKGQMRSNREAKKPKKAPGAEKTKAGAVSAFAKPPGVTAKSHKK